MKKIIISCCILAGINNSVQSMTQQQSNAVTITAEQNQQMIKATNDLFQAIANNDLPNAGQILSSRPVHLDMIDKDKNTILHYLAQFHITSKLLSTEQYNWIADNLKHMADYIITNIKGDKLAFIFAQNNNKETAYRVARYSNNSALLTIIATDTIKFIQTKQDIEYVLRQDIPFSIQGPTGLTLLDLAVKANNNDFVDKLLNNSVKAYQQIYLQDNNGNTALHHAAMMTPDKTDNQQIDALKMITSKILAQDPHGKLIAMTNNKGQTAMNLAKNLNNESVQSAIEQREYTLKTQSMDINQRGL
jgi:hypothetical protein